jgi:hypothetical protein
MNMRTLICFAVLGAGLTGINAQAPARSHRPSAVPEGYLITPFGYFHPSCVKHLSDGDILRSDEGAIQHRDGSFDSISTCNYLHYNVRGEIASRTKEQVKPPSIAHSWIEDYSLTTGSSFGKLVAYWGVPVTPTSSDGQTLYFFPGMEDISDQIGIIQPVLGWNADFTNGWGIASWDYIDTGYGTTYESSAKAVNSGDGIEGTIQSTCSAGTLTCSSWDITTQDFNNSESTTLSSVSNYGQTFNWAFAGALEVYNITQCSDYPPDGMAMFDDLALYDNSFNQVSSPSWSFDNSYSGLTPQCNYGGSGYSTNVELKYGPPQTAEPTNSSSYTTYGGWYPTIDFTETLYDSTSGASIYWQVDGCSGTTSGSSPLSSGDSFDLEYQSSYNCNPSGTMYATAPGYSQSPTVPIYF